MKSGIYIIHNLINNKIYIGSSINVERRLKEHKNNLKENKHCNSHLQNAYNKYKEFFEFDIIEECSIESLPYMEQYWFNITGCTNRDYGYNIDLSAFNTGGKKMSQETKDKIGKRNKGRKKSEETIAKCALSNTGKKHPVQAIKMRERYYNGNPNLLGLKYLSEEDLIKVKIKLSISTRKRYENENNLPKSRKKLKVQIGEEVMFFKSLRHAAKELNIDKGGITYALKYCNGFLKKINAYFEVIE